MGGEDELDAGMLCEQGPDVGEEELVDGGIALREVFLEGRWIATYKKTRLVWRTEVSRQTYA